jgi:hypothetical protein
MPRFDCRVIVSKDAWRRCPNGSQGHPPQLSPRMDRDGPGRKGATHDPRRAVPAFIKRHCRSVRQLSGLTAGAHSRQKSAPGPCRRRCCDRPMAESDLDRPGVVAVLARLRAGKILPYEDVNPGVLYSPAGAGAAGLNKGNQSALSLPQT